jgi:hypothetical protein
MYVLFATELVEVSACQELTLQKEKKPKRRKILFSNLDRSHFFCPAFEYSLWLSADKIAKKYCRHPHVQV